MKTMEFKAPALLKIDRKTMPVVGLSDLIILESLPKPRVALVAEKGHPFATNDTNPLFQVAASLMRFAQGQGVRIRIQKNIPPHVGLGSTISAAQKLAPVLNQLWNLGFSDERLADMAKQAVPDFGWIPNVKCFSVIAIPRLIRLDRSWMKTKTRSKSVESVAFARFPDLKTIRDSLKEAGWKQVGLSGCGPAIVGWSDKRIPKAKIPKPILAKLDFLWIGC